MLHTALIEVYVNEYMGASRKYQITHLVEAESEEEARSILEELYEKKSEQYGIAYSIAVMSIMPVLSKSNVSTFEVEL